MSFTDRIKQFADYYKSKEEFEMSVKELSLYPSVQTYLNVRYGTETQKFAIRLMDDKDDAKVILDRSQAHLLMLYLQEHLK